MMANNYTHPPTTLLTGGGWLLFRRLFNANGGMDPLAIDRTRLVLTINY